MEYSNFTFMESLLVDASKYAKSAENFCRNQDFKHCGADLRLFLEAIMKYLQQVDDISYNSGKNNEAIENLHRKGIINDDVRKWFHFVRQFANSSVHSSHESPSQNEALVALEYAFKIGRFLHNRERVHKFFGDFDAKHAVRLLLCFNVTSGCSCKAFHVFKGCGIVYMDCQLIV